MGKIQYCFMLKPFLATILLCLACLSYAQTTAKRQEVPSKIERVTTFVSGAQITRKANVSLLAGKTELVFMDISPNIDKQSIQVKGDGAFTILSVIHQLNHLKEQTRRDEIIKLENSKTSLRMRAATERNMLTVYKQEEAMLLKNQAIGGQNTGVKTADLREAVDFQRSRLAETLLKQTAIEQNLYKLDSSSRKIDAQMVALNRQQNLSTSEILVTVANKETLNAKFEISYLVKDAGWFATYDLRVQDISKPIDLTFKANIHQNSGEDWKDVKLSISNGNPSEGGAAQKLTPWQLRFGAPYVTSRQVIGDKNAIVGKVSDAETGEPLMGATVMIKGSTIGTTADENGDYKLNAFQQGQILVASYLGYTVQEMIISSNVMNFNMAESQQSLSEVVITGYRDVAESLQGRATGVVAQKNKVKAPEGLKLQEKNLESIALEVGSKQQTTTIVFDIEMPYTVLNDGKLYTAEIKNYNLPATYQYYAAPKLEKDAFLTAQITNWQELNLMDGELNLFFEGAFLGKSVLDLRKASDTLEISLGRDKSIVIERKNLKEFSSKQLLSNYKSESRAYQISVKNNKNQAIKIIIEDHFPISTSKEVSVESKEAKEAVVDDKTQMIVWKYDLPARSEKIHTFKYTVKYPKREILVLD